jgi:hypothetical protein
MVMKAARRHYIEQCFFLKGARRALNRPLTTFDATLAVLIHRIIQNRDITQWGNDLFN